LRSGVQAFRRSGVQAFRRSGVQAFNKLAGFSVSGIASSFSFFPHFSTGVAGGCRPAALDLAVVPGADGQSAATPMEELL
jgi:hypothetical protein